MRKRILPLISLAAATALLVTGCTPTSGEAEPPNLANCLMNLPSGATSDSIKVQNSSGEITLTIPKDAPFADIERTVVSRGTGDAVYAGDLVSMVFQIVSVDSGEVVDSTESGEDGRIPMLLDATSVPVLAVALECLPVGSEVVMAIPGDSRGPGESSLVLYAKAVELLPTRATGEGQAPVAGMPTVVLNDEGAPTVTIPDAAAHAETTKVTLIQGSGDVVQPGDYVVVQYHGVKWSDGAVFDSSWQRGNPAEFATTQVVTGFKIALEGERVGSQILVVIPPKDGYEGVVINAAGDLHQLHDQTLVFVVDILAISNAG